MRSAPNGMVARYGVAVPTRLRHGDTWHTDVCRRGGRLGPQAATVGTLPRKGRGVFIEGRLRWRRWKQEGQYHRTSEVIAERMQSLSHPGPTSWRWPGAERLETRVIHGPPTLGGYHACGRR